MAQAVKELAAMPDDLSWIPGNLSGGRREQTPASFFFSDLQSQAHTPK